MTAQGICSARKKRTGDPCGSFALANGKCRVHGGMSLSGIASPAFRTGRYSKHLPSRLAGRYEEAASDPELLGLRDDIALLDTRISGVVEALDTGESQESWTVLSATWRAFEDQWRMLLDTGEPPEEMESTVEYITKLMRDGLSQGYVWNEIRGLLKERKDLVNSEQKRLVEMQQFISAERAMTFVGAVMASVKRHVSDRAVLASIAADLGALSLRDGSESA